MTKEEILEGNKLIAEFMGAEKLNKASMLLEPFKVLNMVHPITNKKQYVSITALEYHSSWDWLMPVVEKIESLGYASRIVSFSNTYKVCKFIELLKGGLMSSDILINEMADTKIKAVWLATIEFIKWYNESEV